MRLRLSIKIIVALVMLFGCDENSGHDPDATPKEAYTKTIFQSYSPDKSKLLTLREHGWKGERGHTQVFIDFGGSGAGVYTVDTTGVDIKTYWLDDQQIVIETSKSYKSLQKWPHVQSFNNIVKVRYIER